MTSTFRAIALIVTFLAMSFSLNAALLNIDFASNLNTVKTGPAVVGESGSDFWNRYDREAPNGSWKTYAVQSNIVWANMASSPVVLTVSNAPGAWATATADPMFNSYLYPSASGTDIGVFLANLPAGRYDFYCYGHGAANDQNSAFQIFSGGTNYGTRQTLVGSGWSSAPPWNGFHYVVFSNVTVNSGQVAVYVRPGSSAYASLAGLQVLQSASTPTPTNNPVITTNDILNIDFASNLNRVKTGPAVIGNGDSDLWNRYDREDASGGWKTFAVQSNLIWATGVATPMSLTISNAPGAWATASADAMFDAYLYPLSGANVGIWLSSVPSGNYDLFLYGHGAADDQNSDYTVRSGGVDFGTQSTLKGPGWNVAPPWSGIHFVVFSNVVVNNGLIEVTVAPDAPGGLAVIAGLQLMHVSSTSTPTNPPPPTVATNIVNGSFELGLNGWSARDVAVYGPPLFAQIGTHGTNVAGLGANDAIGSFLQQSFFGHGTYRLTFDIAAMGSAGLRSITRVEILNDAGMVIISDTITNFGNGLVPRGVPPFIQKSYDFSLSEANTNVIIRLSDQSPNNGTGIDAVVDKVALTQLAGGLIIRMAPVLSVSGPVGSRQRIDYSDSSSSPNWQVLTNVTLTTSPFNVVDLTAPPSLRRYYRSVVIP